jgi:type IV secretory pathway VirB10-like protein
MAVAPEMIESEPAKVASARASRRPMVIAAAGGVALLSLALWSMLSGAAKKEELREEEKAKVELRTDRGATKELESEAGTRRIMVPGPDGTLVAGPAPGAAPGEPQVAVGPDGNLGVRRDVPELPAQSERGGGGQFARLEPSFGQVENQQLEAHALEVQKWQLDLRKSAFASSSSSPAFAEFKKRQQAEFAQALESLGGGEAGGDPMGALNNGLAMLAAGQRGGGGFGGGPGGVTDSPTALGTDPNMQQEKLRFFQQGGEQLEPGQLGSRVREARSPYVLLMGSVIPGVLISGIHSESPGQIIGQVSESVFDSATGRYLLIPQGARLVGTYSAFISQGQSRVQVAWVRMNFPDGSSLDLEGMSGTDQAGTAGFEDQINRHFAKRLAAALMTTALTVAYEVTMPQNGGLVEGAVHRGVGESLVQLGTDMAREEGKLPPTLNIRAGYRFSIAVNKDITFPGPYEDGIDRRVRR